MVFSLELSLNLVFWRMNSSCQAGDLYNLVISLLLCIFVLFLEFFDGDFLENVSGPSAAGGENTEAGAAADDAVGKEACSEYRQGHLVKQEE